MVGCLDGSGVSMEYQHSGGVSMVGVSAWWGCQYGGGVCMMGV